MIHTPPSARGAVSLKSVTEPERLALLRSLAESDTITTTCDASLLIGGVCFGLTGVVHWVGLGLLGRVRDRDLSGRVVFKVVPVPPTIARLLATWGTLKRVPQSSTIDLFVCEFKNYEPLLNIL